MNTQFRCLNEFRRLAVAKPTDAGGNPVPPVLNGIDYLEVVSDDQKTLKVFFLHPLPGQPGGVPGSPALTAANLRIEGGVRVSDIRVESISASGKELELKVNQAGDFSTYTLRVVTSPTEPSPPPGFDLPLSHVAFSFKVACPSDFDCKAVQVCPPERHSQPEIDYLAKDYAGFRRLMLDRLSRIMPDWKERNPADLQIALVELLAYVGDHLSYYQDAVATEAYLGTARRRISVRRHARLLDYVLHDGCNARAWVSFEVAPGGGADGAALPAGTPVLSRAAGNEITVPPENLLKALDAETIVFETLHDVVLSGARNKISFYTWSDEACCLPRGGTRATLVNDPDLSLKAGDLLLFEEVVSPTTGRPEDADPTHRQVVRLKGARTHTDQLTGTPVVEVEWFEEDALAFPLCVSALVAPAGESPKMAEISVARGNVVLADHGRSLLGEPLHPDTVPDRGLYRPRLPRPDVSFRVPFDPVQAAGSAAATSIRQDPRKARPAAILNDGRETWSPQSDLLGSDRFAPEFVAETERDGSAFIRFGDDLLGKRPSAGLRFSASYRVGNGRAGNIGPESLGRVVTKLNGFTRVRNPLSAAGGTDPESMEQARLFAPQAFRTQERAVTEADWAEAAQRHPQVQRAVARFRWTGSWHTVFVTVDRKGGLPVDAVFEQELRGFLERFRLAGYDMEVDGPRFVPLEIQMRVCVRPGYFRSGVHAALLETFSNRDFPDGRRGFFHPDNFTFGEPVYLSRIYDAALAVAGVASVEALKFQRRGKKAGTELKDGLLEAAQLEIIRLDNDRNFPENGKLEFILEGGL